MSFGTSPSTERDNGSDLGRGERDLWKAISSIREDYAITLRELGRVTTAIEKDQHERRTFSWLKLPVWLGVLAWVALAAVEVWSKATGK